MVITDRRRTGVKTVLPQLLVKFSIIVVSVLLLGSGFTYYQARHRILVAQERITVALAEGTVAGISDMIVTRDYGHIQQTLAQAMANESIVGATVSDARGKILSDVVREDNRIVPIFTDERLTPPATAKQQSHWAKDEAAHTITVWTKIDSNYHIGWLKLVLSTQADEDALFGLTISLVATVGIMILLLAVLVGNEFKKTYDVLNLHEQNIIHAAHYDTLTKLPNRLSLEPTLQQMLTHANRHSTQIAIAFLDLDGFKDINDQYGHNTGDKILFQVAMRMKTALRLDDAVIRTGGDEFVLLLNTIEQHEVEALLNRVIAKINEPYTVIVHGDIETMTVGASIGYTCYPLDNTTPNELLVHADLAMYAAKHKGKNSVAFYGDIDAA